MENTHFEKVQTLTKMPNDDKEVAGVVDINISHCPANGCNTIIIRNWSIKFMNYGYNYVEDLEMSSFLLLDANVPIII